MKTKAIILLSFFVVSHFTSNALNETGRLPADSAKSELFIGYGMMTGFDIGISSMYSIPFGSFVNPYEPSFSGTFFLGFQKLLKERFKLSATFAYEKIKLESVLSSYQNTGNYYSFLAGIKFKYNKVDAKVHFYGRFDIGGIIYDENTTGDNQDEILITPSKIAMQISPICISFGELFGGFAEIGFGSLGLFNFGIYYRF